MNMRVHRKRPGICDAERELLIGGELPHMRIDGTQVVIPAQEPIQHPPGHRLAIRGGAVGAGSGAHEVDELPLVPRPREADQWRCLGSEVAAQVLAVT